MRNDTVIDFPKVQLTEFFTNIQKALEGNTEEDAKQQVKNFSKWAKDETKKLIAGIKADLAKKYVWSPLPGSQTLALSCPAAIILYHGSRGPGKTDAQLMRFRARVGKGYGKFWKGIIFDREYKNLDDLVAKSLRWFPEFNDGAKFLASKSDYKWVWPTGEELLFRVVKRDSDYYSYHGHEYPFIGWNELTKYPTDSLFDQMMSCNRSSFVPWDYPIIDHKGNVSYLPEIPLEVFATTNPYGSGHNWVKRRLINGTQPGTIQRTSVNVYNPRTNEREDVVRTSTHIFGSYKENRYLSPLYVATLESMTDLNKRLAWLQGSWDIVAGGMFDDVWDKRYQLIREFTIPHNWRVDRSFDWGSSKPFSVGWWAESDGSDVQMADGTWRSTVRGDLFRIAEWYGWSGKTNEGLRMLAAEVSAGIVKRELTMGIHSRVKPGPADNSIWDAVNGASIAADMARDVRVDGKVYPGVRWNRSNKSPGSRKHGWEKMRAAFKNAHPVPGGVREKPGLYVFVNCNMFVETVPVLPRDEEDLDDVDTDAEDHIGDEARYRVLEVGTGARGGRNSGT